MKPEQELYKQIQAQSKKTEDAFFKYEQHYAQAQVWLNLASRGIVSLERLTEELERMEAEIAS